MTATAADADRFLSRRAMELRPDVVALRRQGWAKDRISRHLRCDINLVRHILAVEGDVNLKRGSGPKPIDYPPKIAEQVRQMWNEGATLNRICTALDLQRRSLQSWIIRDGLGERPAQRVFPIEPLAQAVGGISRLCKRTSMSSDTFHKHQENGLPMSLADKLAIKCGYMPHDIWDDWWDD